MSKAKKIFNQNLYGITLICAFITVAYFTLLSLGIGADMFLIGDSVSFSENYLSYESASSILTQATAARAEYYKSDNAYVRWFSYNLPGWAKIILTIFLVCITVKIGIIIYQNRKKVVCSLAYFGLKTLDVTLDILWATLKAIPVTILYIASKVMKKDWVRVNLTWKKHRVKRVQPNEYPQKIVQFRIRRKA